MINENNNLNRNNTDFQAKNENDLEFVTKKEIDDNKENIVLNSSDSNNDCIVTDNNDFENTAENPKENETNEEVVSSDLNEDNNSEINSESSEIENKNCTLDHVKDEKLKNLSFGCIPFIITAIAISLFNIGKVRQPLSFLFLALGLLELSITYFYRHRKVTTSCNCKKCIHQSKSLFKLAVFYGIAALGLLGVFIYFLVI